MDRDPLPGDQAGRKPMPEAKKMVGKGMKNKGAVRLRPVQIDRDNDDGDARQRERDDDWAPQGKLTMPEKSKMFYSDLRVRSARRLMLTLKAQTMLCALPSIVRACGPCAACASNDRYSITVRLPRLTSADTSMPAETRNCWPSRSR